VAWLVLASTGFAIGGAMFGKPWRRTPDFWAFGTDGQNRILDAQAGGNLKADLQATPVMLRPMTEQDIPMLYDWLNRPHIVEWWGGDSARPSLEDVYDKYMPRVLAKESVTPYIAMLGQVPIGYAQSYIALGSGDGWWEDETDPGVRGIDQSIAEPDLLGNGIGTRLVRALVDMLFRDPSVSKIQTDPAPTNLRAIRCYQKAGFRVVRNIVTPDGQAVYMLQERPKATAGSADGAR
jgi:AacA4 family aminoglycoside N(6')-acetyltransferase